MDTRERHLHHAVRDLFHDRGQRQRDRYGLIRPLLDGSLQVFGKAFRNRVERKRHGLHRRDASEVSNEDAPTLECEVAPETKATYERVSRGI